ncbi:putative acetyltransferase [Virgibacillus natechei]|uniref:Acetyltransferase n=1 Tax=Virgibacillus natechei TaxID=1216297 RepID=A0ABS4IIV7_9BACI|nr:GNAT family N-acetyltransferase [Virgibacillus natechei]MBP1970897.1 putative acetyltransferase [Virgibacillus natechei]UZD13280.1 GNAT family N-acetyltransferase [Virgibacillus natechei]
MKNIQTLTEANYEEIFSLSQFAFQYELSEEDLEKKKVEAHRHTIWGWMEEAQIAAKLHLIPLPCYIHGKPFEMGGISGVATWPEYRRRGMVKHLLYHALKQMKQNGQALSFLHPFSFAFYRKYGWEHTFTNQQYSIPVERLKNKWDAKGYVRRIQPDIELLHGVYTEYAKSFNGMLVRDEKWWEQRVLKDKSLQIAVAYDTDDHPEGYLLYKVKENVLTVKEMVYHNLNARKLLLDFMGNHDSMANTVSLTVPEGDNLALLLDDPTFEQKLQPYFMARIVDVRAFLKEYPFQGEANLSITVEDSFFPENSGTYSLQHSGERLDDHKASIYCSIQVLTGMLLGYKRPKDYEQAGLLNGDGQAIDQLEDLIPRQHTFFADFF